MPVSRDYVVTQEREVWVRSSSAVEAAKEADLIFECGEAHDGSNRNQISPPKITRMEIRES